MYKRIAVAVDGSKTSDAALSEAIKLGKVMSSSILLLHVCEEMPVMITPEGVTLMDTQLLMEAIVKAGNALLQKCSATVSNAGLVVETLLIETYGIRTGSEISKAALNAGAELLVVGTHGRKGIDRLLMGSVAEHVMRTATMPVLLVRGS